MSIKEFIAQLGQKHFSLKLENNKLILQADRSVLDEEAINAIKTDKEVIDFIKSNRDSIVEFLKQNITENNNAKRDIESLYPLSALQQGMMFHGLYDEHSSAYINQFRCDLIGLDLEAFNQSWIKLLRKHSILRSGFYFDSFSQPMQGVFKNVKLPINILDYSQFPETEISEKLADFELKDQKSNFDFKTPPLMRITLIQLKEGRFRMFWTSHHILFDGWSKQILVQELLTTYDAISSGKLIEDTEIDQFEDFIKYLERINHVEEKKILANLFKTPRTKHFTSFCKSNHR